MVDTLAAAASLAGLFCCFVVLFLMCAVHPFHFAGSAAGGAVSGVLLACMSEPNAEMSTEEVNLSIGDRLEVSWQVECIDGTSDQVWWGGTLQRSAKGVLEVRYDAEHDFEEETREVAFWSPSELRDLALSESLLWRHPGAGDDETDQDEEGEAEVSATSGQKRARDVADLGPGTLVKAQLDGSGRTFSAWIETVNDDGTLDLAYDGSVVQGVPADMVEPVALETTVADALERGEEGEHIDGTEAFFDAFTAALTSGPTFQRLSAHQQAVAGEKVKALRTFFEEELAALRTKRGHGAMVTDADVQAMLPRVVARSKAV